MLNTSVGLPSYPVGLSSPIIDTINELVWEKIARQIAWVLKGRCTAVSSLSKIYMKQTKC